MKELENIGKLKDDLFEHPVFEKEDASTTEDQIEIMAKHWSLTEAAEKVLKAELEYLVLLAKMEQLKGS